MDSESSLKNRLSSMRGLQSFWPLLIPLLFFIPGLKGFPYPSPEAAFSDIAISHYPNALYLKGAITEWGVIPLWSPTILSGYPFAANPLSGLWYPPGWLALLFPLPMGFNLLVMAHLLLGGVGLYRLLRLENCSHQAALMGALAFESLPKLLGHYGAGHLTLVYAVSWTPWLLACHVSSSKLPAKRISKLKPGIVLALIFLADPRWAPYAGLLWLLHIFAHRRSAKEIDKHRKIPTTNLQLLISNIQYLLSNLLIPFLLTAPLAFPLLEFTRLSTRSVLTSKDVFAHSLPPARLLGFLFPDFGGFHEWMLYPGGVVLVLLMVSVLLGLRRRGVRFWLAVYLLSTLFALGANLPLLPALARIPGFDLLRVPPRGLFLAGMAGAILAAYGLDALSGEIKDRQRRVNMSLAGLAAFVMTFALSVRALTGVWAGEFLWGAGAITLASLWVLIDVRGQVPRQTWLVVLFGMALLDWGAINATVLSFRNQSDVVSKGGNVGEYLSKRPGDFRVYSPSYSLPQNIAALYELELADGVDPLQLSAYVDFMDLAAGVPRPGYGVTLPAFSGGDPSSDNAEFRPDPASLGLLNVAYVVAEFELPVDGLVLLERFGETRLYENTTGLPRAWIQPDDGEIGVDVTPAEILAWKPNQISLQAQGPGLLVLSEIAYPGWKVTVDGQAAEMQQPLGLLRAVVLSPGEHKVIFSFRPVSVYLGLGCFILGLIILLWVRKGRRLTL